MGWWTWRSGANTINQLAINVRNASDSSIPGSMQFHSTVMDSSGTWMYLYGGNGYDDKTTNNKGETPWYCQECAKE